MHTTTLRANQLAIGYGGKPLVSGISFNLTPGEAIAVLGRNGSGKTTLFRTLLGLLPGIAGSVQLGDRAVHALSPAELARLIAFVPQSVSPTLGLTVLEAVEMARAPHLAWYAAPRAHDRSIALAALAELGMARFAHRPLDELSSGEKQLAMIARALAAEAPVILMDEPTANLDFGNQYLLLDEIAKLKSRGLAVMFTTHAPDHALRIADRTLTLARDGHATIGDTATILTAESLGALYEMPIALITTASGAAGVIPAVPAIQVGATTRT
jgi:iron complex transport system ATP-binding protein